MKNVKFLLYLIFECNSFFLTAQYQIHDTAYINQLTDWAIQNQMLQTDSAFVKAHIALKLSNNSTYDHGIADACYALGIIHMASYSEDDSITFYLDNALKLYGELGDKKGIGKVYYAYAYFYSLSGNLKDSEKSLHKSLECFERSKNKQEIYKVYNSLSYISKQYKDYDKSGNYLIRCIQIGEELQDTAILSDAHNNLGNLYKDQGLFQPAIDAYFKALELSESIKDSSGLAIAYGSIGNLYYYQESYQEALIYLKKKVPISRAENSHWELSKTLNSIALAYNAMNMPDTAITYLHQSLHINLKMKYPTGIADVYQKLAETHFMIQDIDSANFYINKAIELGKKSNTEANLAEFYIIKGKIESSLENYDLALANLQKAYTLAKKLEMPLILKNASMQLSNLFIKKNNPAKAYFYLKEYIALKDSLSNDEHLKKITRLEMTYEFDKKNRKILFEKEQERLKLETKMKQQKMYLFGATGFFLLILLLGILFFRQKNLHMRFKTIDLEQRLLRTQMNPHFIFNSLCSIQDFILRKNTKEANSFLTRFAVLIRSTLENSRKDFIPLEDEIKILENYLELQKLRFEADFDYTINIDPDIDTETYAIPPMIAQPFIENSIEHGLLPKKEKGKLEIKYSINDKTIRFELHDDGVGMHNKDDKTETKKYNKTSLATVLTLERLRYLKGMKLKNVNFEISERVENNQSNGTKVVFNIPYITIVG